VSTKHKKFASNSANYRALDEVLGRLRRKTKDEVAEEEEVERLELEHECTLNRREMRLRVRDLSSP
jgi:regulatory subunit for Cdc7p protein kinase